jgi:hypothetical protein
MLLGKLGVEAQLMGGESGWCRYARTEGLLLGKLGVKAGPPGGGSGSGCGAVCGALLTSARCWPGCTASVERPRPLACIRGTTPDTTSAVMGAATAMAANLGAM